METPLIYEELEIQDILTAWGGLILAFFISTVGFLVSRATKSIIVAWISLIISIFMILAFSLFVGYQDDPFRAVFFDETFFISAFFISVFSIFSTFISFAELEVKDSSSHEFPFFMFLSAVGAILMTSSRDLLTLFLSKELMSFPIYAMVYAFRDRIGVEAALKYFIAGSLFSLVYLMGFSFFLISEGSILINEPKGILGILGLYLVVFSLMFKGGTAPFHFWVPDVYQGAPSSVVTFAGAVVKFSSFLTIARVLEITKVELHRLFEVISILSIAVGVLGALTQKEIKRIVAYSSISHSGFILFFLFLIGDENVKRYLIFYLASYGMTIIGIFGILSLFKKNLIYLDDIVGFSKVHRPISILISIFLISSAGIPLTAGFFAKYLSFLSAIQAQRISPIIFGALGSIASLYFYFQPISKSFMEERNTGENEKPLNELQDQQVEVSKNTLVLFLILVLALSLILFGVFPGALINLIEGIPLSF